MNKPSLRALLLLFGLMPAAIAAQNPLDVVAEDLEKRQMERLAAQQRRHGVHIAPFRTDGCSGGMSQSWSILANTLPPFASDIGNSPPWEHCCVAHDRDYWRGETDGGYRKRLQADDALRACVQRTGLEKGAEIAARLDLPPEQIIDIIDLTGELMYHAVRVGGGPCTGLPWRWGYGWPGCSTPLEPGNQI